ncbi:MAG: hypothetical protein H8D80_00670 [Proteobacteria bacterium]|nr:hypothetical protein [Pseudomonadota bacterium]
MATTKVKTPKKTKTPKKGYKILWLDDSGLFVKVEEKGIQKGLIIRYTDVQFGEVDEETGNIPVSFTADILDNPKNIDFDATDEDGNTKDEYLGNLVTCVVLDSIANDDGLIQTTGNTDGTDRSTDSE